MRIVSIENVTPGMRLAKAIYREDDGNILLKPNAELTEYAIRRIRQLNYSYLYVLDPGDVLEDYLALEPIKEETRIKAEVLIKRTVKSLETNEGTRVDELRTIVTDMVEQILRDNEVIYNMVDIRSHDGYTYAHSVNVCIISLMIGSRMGLTRQELEKMGIGALLHDVGKVFIDSALLNKPGRLEPHEYEVIKKHARNGYDILKTKVNISFLSAHVAFQHHEREDGTGYPRGLTGWRIHRFAKIVAVADVYDAMTSHRVYRRAIPSHMVIEEMRREAEDKYDSEVINHLVKVIAPYPIGSILLLSNGETVLVTSVTNVECRVKVMSGIDEGKTFNLYTQSSIYVVERLN